MFKQAKIGRGLSAGTSRWSQSNGSWSWVPISCHGPPKISAQRSYSPDKLRLVRSWRERERRRERDWERVEKKSLKEVVVGKQCAGKDSREQFHRHERNASQKLNNIYVVLEISPPFLPPVCSFVQLVASDWTHDTAEHAKTQRVLSTDTRCYSAFTTWSLAHCKCNTVVKQRHPHMMSKGKIYKIIANLVKKKKNVEDVELNLLYMK